MIYIATHLLNPLDPENIQYIPDCWMGLENGIIASLSSQPPEGEWLDKRDCLCLPGLIDSHVHLSQYDMRGSHASGLLPWLQNYVFPAESKSADENYARDIALRFFKALVSRGTTTSVVYTSPYKIACETAFEVASELQVRSIIGMTMMDTNSPAYLQQSTDYALKESAALCEKWQNKGLLDYIFSPRFALTCSETLLSETGRLAEIYQARIQSHLAENGEEIARIKRLFPDFASYTDIYYRCGILGSHSIMGHCLHLTEREIRILQETDTRIAFCPDSNFFLKSGRFPFEKLAESGIKIALASDVGAGTDLSLFEIMKVADYTLSGKGLNPVRALYTATRGAAEVLNLQDKIGSLEIGKAADMIFIKRDDDCEDDPVRQLSRYIYLNREISLDSTWVNGIEIYKEV